MFGIANKEIKLLIDR